MMMMMAAGTATTHQAWVTLDWVVLFTWLRTDPLGWACLALIGGCLGSFINVVIYRLPRGVSLVRPRSRCPSCERPVRAHENVPVLSFLWLRGRCRGCGAPIGLRYPIVEGLGAALTVAAVTTAGGPLEALVRAGLALALLAVLFIDLDFRIIPDPITLPGTMLGLLWALVGPLSLPQALLGALVGGGGLLAVAWAYQRLTGREGLGMGDVKLMAMVGAFTGWQGALGTILIGSLAGSLVGVGLMLHGTGSRQTALPFGAFLAPATWVILFLGDTLWQHYLKLFPGV